MSFDGTYNVLSESGKTLGTLTVCTDGLKTCFSLDCEVTNEIQRLICTCGNSPVSIGIPVPEYGRLKLSKCFSKAQLKSMGMTEISSATLIPAAAPLSGIIKKDCAEENSPNSESAHSDKDACDNAADASFSPADEKTIPSGTPDGWECENNPSRFFKDPHVVSLCRGIQGALWKNSGKADLLAIPVSESSAFPLSTFLCFGEPMVYGQNRYIVFKIENGMPV